MIVSLEINGNEKKIIEKYAAKNNVGVADFLLSAALEKIANEETKAARNAEYFAVIDESLQRIRNTESKGSAPCAK